MSSVWHRCLYLFFPKRCRLCGEVIALDETLCEECGSTKAITGKICHKCGREEKDCVCQQQKFSPGYQSFCAPYYFEGSVRHGVYRIKSSGYTELVSGMAEAIEAAVIQRFAGVSFDIVTFVPMKRLRERKRGYNQSRLLAEAVAERLDVPCIPTLQKIKNTRSQRRSNAAQRKVNLYGAFAVADNTDVSGKTILIVDDVKTTGYTLSECAVMLHTAGAGTVYAAAFAVTPKKHEKRLANHR